MPDQNEFTARLPKIVRTIGRVFQEEGDTETGAALSTAFVTVQETSFDNWNGGTYGYTLQLQVPVQTFVKLGRAIEDLEEDIKTRITRFARSYPNEHVESVVITPSYLDSELAFTGIPAIPSFWKDSYFRLFLSHASADKSETTKLASALSDYGIYGFVAHAHIEPIKEWEDEIRLALTTCDALACLLTNDFGSSQWTNQEVGFAVGLGKLVIPIRLGIDPYGFLARYQGYSGLNVSHSEIASALVKILAHHELTRAKMASALVASFEQSDSFANAKRTTKNLELVRHWAPEFIERVKQASSKNDQIARAFGVPDRVRQILSSINKT